MCRMQLDFNCKRYLQNPKFLVWTITLVENFTICFVKLQLPFVGASLDKNNYTFKNSTIALTMYLSSTLNCKNFNKVRKIQYHQN